MKLTLFLGAGFSVPFGHPVMDSFLGFADSNPHLTDEDRLFLRRLVLEARQANSFLESSPTNLEDILTFSEMGERLSLLEGSENRSDKLKILIQKIYTTILPAGDYWGRYKRLKALIGAAPGEFKGSLSFITTNYDLNIESACVALGSPVDLGFQYERLTKPVAYEVLPCYQSGGPPLFKLHGSVNWYPSAEHKLLVEDRVVAVSGGGEKGEVKCLPMPCAGNYTPPGVPIIVPPTFLKPDLDSILKTLWAGAARALSTANVVAFVGYSFPQSDTEMMYFLARALSENVGLRVVYIVDPRADEIVTRLRGPASKMGSHFRALLHPIKDDWTNVALPFRS